MMNAKKRKLVTLGAVMLALCFFSLEESASAQGNCRKVRGRIVDVVDAADPNRATGRITNGGILNGTTVTVFDPAVVFTPDPAAVSFIADTTLTTDRGVLKTHNVYVFDFVRGVGAALYRIDPNASAGIFAGATGVLYVNAKSTGPGTVEGVIAGEICLAHGDEDEDESR